LLAQIFTNLGVLARGSDRVEDAKRSYEEAIALFEVLVRDGPENVKYRLGLSRASYNLGSLFIIHLNNIRESKKYLEKARALYQGLVDDTRPSARIVPTCQSVWPDRVRLPVSSVAG